MGDAILYAAAYYYLSRRARSKANDDRVNDFTPTTLATQGDFVPVLIGRRRIGSLITYVGDRGQTPGQSISAKGSSRRRRAPGTQTWVESGWQLLCVGPAWKLHKIYQDGQIIFTGPIDRDTTPSGTALQTTVGETFVIYWGEADQAANAYLGDAGRVGITSQWPGICYIQWTQKNLGPQPRWPLLEYDIEVEPNLGGIGSEITDCAPANAVTVAWEDAGEAAIDTGLCALEKIGTVGNQVSFDTNIFNVPTEGYYRIYQNNPAGQDIQIQFGHAPSTHSPAATWQRFKISLDGVTMWEMLNFGVIGPPGLPGDEECWPYSEILGAGGLRRYSIDEPEIEDQVVYLTAGAHTLRIDTDVTEDGSAAQNEHFAQCRFYFKRVEAVEATVLSQLFFGAKPYGLACDVTLFDVDSLRDVEAALEAEGIAQSDISVIAADGEDAATVISQVMQDCGLMIYRDPTTGLLTFRLNRRETPVVVPEEAVHGLPEIEITQDEQQATRLIFEFANKDREFRMSTISIDDDGAAAHLLNHRARKVSIPTTVDHEIAGIIAERRSQEELAGGKLVLKLTRAARLLIPSQVVRVYGLQGTYRVLEVEPEADSDLTIVTVIPDCYGVEVSSYTPPVGGDGSSGATPPAADLASAVVEVPAHLLDGGPPAIAVPRIRAHDQIAYADLWLSSDSTTYERLDSEFDLQTGGTLLDALPATDSWIIDEGPTFTLLGPDASIVQDLSADEANWKRGRQVAIIGNEIFHLQKITAMGGAVYRLDGLVRARYDTVRATHAIGATVLICDFREILTVSDPILAPGATAYVKMQPWTSTPLALGAVVAISKVLKGKGVTPMAVACVRVVAPVKGGSYYKTGNDVEFAWNYRSTEFQRTGAGMQGVGEPVGISAPQGEFQVRVYDAADVLVATYGTADGVDELGWTYANADLAADLGGETNFRIEVFNINGSLRSDAASLSITKL